jgi:hypothetical protein
MSMVRLRWLWLNCGDGVSRRAGGVCGSRSGLTRPYICLLIILTRLTLRAENPVRGSDQMSCLPGAPAVMITDDVPAVRVPPDYATGRVAAGHPVALVALGGRTLILDLETGQWVKTGTISDRLMVGGPKTPSALILISGSLARVAGGQDGIITVQDATSTQSLPGKHDGPVTAVACQHLVDRPLAFTGGQDGKVRVWDLAARQLLDVVDVTGPVFAIEVTEDGDLLVGAAGEAIAFQHANFLPGRSGAPRRRATGRKRPSRLASVAHGGQR